MDLKHFTRLIIPYKDKMFRLAKRLLGNQPDAEDAVQLVLIKIWQKDDDLSFVKNLEGWIMRLTYNQSIDLIRGRRKNVMEINGELPKAAQKPEADVQLENKDNSYWIRNAMNQLPEKQKMVLQLREIEEMSYQEISEILEMPIGQVKTNIFRARKQLHAELLKMKHHGSHFNN